MSDFNKETDNRGIIIDKHVLFSSEVGEVVFVIIIDDEENGLTPIFVDIDTYYNKECIIGNQITKTLVDRGGMFSDEEYEYTITKIK